MLSELRFLENSENSSGLMPSLEVATWKIFSQVDPAIFYSNELLTEPSVASWGAEACLPCPIILHKVKKNFPFAFSMGQFGMRGLSRTISCFGLNEK